MTIRVDTVLSKRPLRNRSRQALFLCYHSIADDGPPFLSVPPDMLESHLRALRATGWATGTIETLRGIADGRRPIARHVFLTFDDGFRDNLTEALPRLRTYGFSAFLFVLPPLVDTAAALEWPEVAENRRCHPEIMRSLSWPEVEELADAGWEIGSHGLRHAHLPILPDEELRQELLDSRRRIGERLGRCEVLAYPFGEWSARTAAAAHAAGYSFAFTLPWGQQLRAAPQSIPRVTIDHRDTPGRFAAKRSSLGRSLLFSPLRQTVRWLARRRPRG